MYKSLVASRRGLPVGRSRPLKLSQRLIGNPEVVKGFIAFGAGPDMLGPDAYGLFQAPGLANLTPVSTAPSADSRVRFMVTYRGETYSKYRVDTASTRSRRVASGGGISRFTLEKSVDSRSNPVSYFRV